MTLWKLYLSDEHRALLDLAAVHTGRPRAAVVRSALEAYLPGVLLAESTPEQANAAGDNRGAQKSNALDHDSS
jgi:hypothetical protein